MKTKYLLVTLGICAIILGTLGYRAQFQSSPAVPNNWITYINTEYGFGLKRPQQYDISQRAGIKEYCNDTPFDEIVIKDTEGKDILVANNGKGCIGGFPSTLISTEKLGNTVTKTVSLDKQNDLDPSNDRRYATYSFGNFISGPVYDSNLEMLFDQIFSTYKSI